MTMDKHAGLGGGQPLLIILGPTACGKTALSLELASRLSAEIISADSMQVYRGLDIGTAKLPPEERRGIPHHLLDIRDPAERFSVADFRRLAGEKIGEIAARGHLPLVVGGTGLYINSLLYPYNFAFKTEADPDLRRQLQQQLAEQGGAALHRQLQAADPQAASRIHPNDSYRLLRALEVYRLTGRPISQLQAESGGKPDYRALVIGLRMEREVLYQRIEQRVDQMLAAGLVAETAAVLQRGLSRQAVAMQGLGYRQIGAYLAGEIDLEQAVYLIKRDTRRFAKRQMTWFKRNPEINWLDVDHYREEEELTRAAGILIADRLKEE